MIEFENRSKSIVAGVVSLEIARRVTGTARSIHMPLSLLPPPTVASEPALNCRS